MSEESLTTEDVFERASELLHSGHPAEALELFAFLAEDYPQFPGGHWMKGVALAALNRPDEAVTAFQTGLELQPGDTMAMWNMALSLAHAGRLPEAIGVLRDAYQEHPDFFDALFFMGHLYALQNGSPVEPGFAQWVTEHERGTFNLQSPFHRHLYILGLIALGERKLVQQPIEDLRKMDAARAAHVEALLSEE